MNTSNVAPIDAAVSRRPEAEEVFAAWLAEERKKGLIDIKFCVNGASQTGSVASILTELDVAQSMVSQGKFDPFVENLPK